MSFQWPSVWWLLALVLVPLAWWRWASRRRRAAAAFSDLAPVASAGRTWAVRLRWALPALRTLALVLLVVGLARPRLADRHTHTFTDAVAIQLVVDRSGSMRAVDFELDGRAADRLSAVKQVVEGFVLGTDDLPGRPDDLVGLITFARYADSRCPLTLDHEHLVDTVRQTTFVDARQEEDGTAIGDAIALGVERLQNLEERADLTAEGAIKSRVMILLTDGENNRGDIDPLTAARMAAAFGIRVYTIGAGSDAAFAPVPVIDPFGRERLQRMPVSIDEETLTQIADITGGRYFRATDTDSLRNIYARIDELERTRIEERRYAEYKELAVEGVQVGRVHLPPVLVVVFVLLGLEMVLASTRLGAVP